MNYIEIDFEKVKGYGKLSGSAKQFFERMYKKHNSSFSLEEKKNWIPTMIKQHKTYLEVHFKNKQWLHYYLNGTWY